jgi:hypothetical protein
MTFAWLALSCVEGLAQDPPKAARSVHLGWSAAEGTDFHHALTVEESTPGSYFMACGWNTGYFGLQELSKGDKIVLFSVWDPTKGDDPKLVPADRRVEALHQDPAAKIGRFGGEGTGAQCKYPYAWKIGETCRFLVRAAVDGDKTAYAGWFFRNDTKAWVHLATFRALTKGAPLKGYYAFVEDFRRDGKSAGERRRARFSDGWVRSTKNEWLSLDQARFTADATPLDSIDAAVVDDGFTLSTGGDVKRKAPLNGSLSRPGTSKPPADLP